MHVGASIQNFTWRLKELDARVEEERVAPLSGKKGASLPFQMGV